MMKSASAARSIFLRMESQGVSRSDSEIAQKSCPKGAPTSEAHALMAEIPGTMFNSGFPSRVHPFSCNT